jgi:hypothetical protein
MPAAGGAAAATAGGAFWCAGGLPLWLAAAGGAGGAGSATCPGLPALPATLASCSLGAAAQGRGPVRPWSGGLPLPAARRRCGRWRSGCQAAAGAACATINGCLVSMAEVYTQLAAGGASAVWTAPVQSVLFHGEKTPCQRPSYHPMSAMSSPMSAGLRMAGRILVWRREEGVGAFWGPSIFTFQASHCAPF